VTSGYDRHRRATEKYHRETEKLQAERGLQLWGRRRRRRHRSRRSKVGRGLVVVLELGVVVVVLVLAAALWIFIHALDATGRLSDARTDIQRVQADLLAGRSALADMRQAQDDASAARNDTHDPVWSAASWLPPVKTVRGITTAIDTLATGALPDVVRVGSGLSPAALRIAPNRIALAPLVAAAPTMRAAAAAATLARTEVASLPSGWIGLISTARTKILSELTSLSGSVDDVARFATVGPNMLGQHGMRRYFVGIQNNAEARATGGLVAAYAVVTADHGWIHVAEHGSDALLQTFHAPAPVVDLGPDYDHEYGNYHPAQQWITSNVSPDFPSAGDIWAHLWERQTGQHIDGSFGVDPVGLASILGAVGPVTVPGYPGEFDGANLATVIESTEYAAFPGLDNTRRKNFLSQVGTTVLHKMLSGSGSPQAIASALGAAAGGGHLALWSDRPAEQDQIFGTPLSGELSPTTAPFASVSVDNATASKLDYYLDRTLRYTAGSCSASRRESSITVTLDNAAPRHGLPAYVRLVTGTNGQTYVEQVPDNRLFVFIHATAGAALQHATLDGKPIAVGEGVERGHPVYLVDVLLHPGVPRTIVLNLSEPTVAGAASTQVQPLARPQQTTLDVPQCS
jgi:phage gp37-like protein